MMRILATAMLLTTAASSRAPQDLEKRLYRSAQVVREMVAGGIPADVVLRAKCVVVIPDMKRGAFIAGAQYGAGFAVCKTQTGWSAPSGVQVEGGSLGAQIGASETDLVVLVMDDAARDRLLKRRLAVSASAGAKAGRKADGAVDKNVSTIVWAHTSGAFAELSVHGVRVEEDNGANQALYGRKLSPQQILEGRVTAPSVAYGFEAALRPDGE